MSEYLMRDGAPFGEEGWAKVDGMVMDVMKKNLVARRFVEFVGPLGWGVEVVPNETPDCFQPLHMISLRNTGLLLGEIFHLDPLSEACADDGRYAFLFTAPPLPITGAVGSPINPLAIK